MDLVVIAGFLGSGKTSLLLRLARHLAQDHGRKLAIIENDVGEVPVDAVYLEHEGFAVRTLFAGCVCCQLRADLLTALYGLERDLAPDVVLMEPSGVASPRQVIDALSGYAGDLGTRAVVVVVDAVRFHHIRDFSHAIFERAMDGADVIALNKIDAVPEADWSPTAAELRRLHPGTTVLPLSARQGDGLETLWGLLAARTPPRQPPPPAAQAQRPAVRVAGPDTATFAAELRFALPAPLPGEVLTGRLRDCLPTLQNALRAAGCGLLGHAKLVLHGPRTGCCLMSLTTLDGEPETRGRLLPSVCEGRVTVNVIACGMAQDDLTRVGREFMRDLEPQLSGTFPC